MDDPMLSLFDSDSTNFLDELTGSNDGLGGSIGMDGGNVMGPQGPGMMETMQQQQPQQPGGWGGMPQQQGMNPQQQKLHHFMDDCGSNQYVGDANLTRSQGNMSMANSAPRMMSPSHPQQFSSPPPGSSAGPMQSPQHAPGGGYPPYAMQHGSPGVTPPRQPTPQPGQMGMNQTAGMWNQSPGTQQPNMSGSPYGSLQQPAGGPRAVGPHGQTQYMSHHDYVLPPNPNRTPATPMAQQLTHFAEQQQMNSQNNFAGGHPQMGSPPPAQRLSHVPMQNPNAMGMSRPQRPMAPGLGQQYPLGSQSAMMQSQGNMPNFSSSQTNLCHPGYNSVNDPMGQQGQISSGPQVNGMRFPYQGGNTPTMIQAQQGMSQGMGEVPRLSHFPQSPSHQSGTPQYRQPFPGMGGPQLASPRPMSSPLPTPPPPSLAATGHMQSSPHMATSQGTFTQSSLQQMEQLVPQTVPMSMGVSASMSMGVPSSGYGQGMQPNVHTVASSTGTNQMGPRMPVALSQGFNGGQPGIGPNGPSPGNMASMNSTGPRISTGMPSYSQGPMAMNQMSPMRQQQHIQQMQQQQGQPPQQLNMANVPPQVQHQMNQMNREINDLQIQIQQLYNMPQNPQTQQQMLDLQERMRTLKAQQQQQIMHQQRQQQQMKQAQILQQQVKIAPAPNASMSPQLGLSVPRPQQPQQAQVTVMPKQPPIRMQQPGQQMMPQQQPNSQIRMPQPNTAMVAMTGSAPTTQPVASSLPHQLQQQQQATLVNQPSNSPAMGNVEGTPPQLQVGTPQAQQVTPPMLVAQSDTTSSQQMEPQITLNSSPPELSLPDELLNTENNSQDSDGQNSTSKEQEKANKIIAEAIAKAQAEGRDVPNVNEESEPPAKGKKKRSPKKKKEPKTPKEPKEPKPKKTPTKKKASKKKKGGAEAAPAGEAGETSINEEGDKSVEGEEKKEAKKKEDKPKPVPRPKSVKKKKTLPTFLLKKNRKKKNESEDEEADVGQAPGSPIDEDSLLKRRSGRHAKRKKYLDEVDLQLSDEDPSAEKLAETGGMGAIRPENPVEEDSMIVEKILAVRTGKRQKYIPFENEEHVDVVVDVVVDVIDESKDTKSLTDLNNISDAKDETDKAPEANNVKEEKQPDNGETDNTDKEEKPEGETVEENVDVEGNSDEVPVDDIKQESSEEQEKEEQEKEADQKTDEADQKTDEVPALPENSTGASDSESLSQIAPVPRRESSAGIEENCSLKKEANQGVVKEDKEMEYIEVEEFFVKYKNFSYLHCEWRTADELELGDKRVQQKLKRFRIKRVQQSNLFSQWDDEEHFNPEYVEVDRVLDLSVVVDPVSGEDVSHYLVKWRGLPYEDSTWELQTDVDKVRIEHFKKFRDAPPEEERVVNNRPSPKDWRKMEESPVFKNDNTLREYQLEGVSWLTFSYYNKQNCILADEMGLGKTIQSITFLQQVISYGIKGPFLVIVPLSTIGNWQREFETWTDMNVIVYHGSTPSRNMLQEYEMYYKDEKGQRIPDIFKFSVLITTFEIVISDCEELCQIEWRVCIIDEAHRLKNRNCKLLEGLKLFDLEHRCLLTGTPLQNNIDELFSLLNFLEPKQFASSESFLKDFGDLKSEEQVEKLKAVLKPMMLRRLKGDVEKSLAPKTETIVEVELTNIQKKYYRAILEKNFSFLAKGTSTTNVPNLMNTMMELRKCCNHPYLINGAEEQIMIETRAQFGSDPEKQFQALVNAAGKLVLIDKLLPKLKAGDHRVLIFSQMIRVLDIIEDYLIQRKYLYERIDGRIRGNLRQEAIDRFSKPDSDKFVFLLCTRAGGLGINLTAADTVIIYDSDWNPQNDLQAQARCHRIGQNKAVKVYRLLTRNTYEREMFDKASKKLGLDKAVLQSMGTKEINSSNQLSKKEVEELLKKGAYGSLMEDDSQADQFCEEDIDSILQRRTQVITIEAGEKGSTFSKASFSTATSRSDISIDDPHFWEKWAKKADMDYEELTNKNDLIIEMPRVRKQTARYGNQDQVLNMSELETSDSESELDDAGQRIKKGSKKSKKLRRKREEEGEMNDGNGEYYARSDCFKVEKNLLVYGWGRWEDILYHGRFKRKLQTTDVETMTRAILSYSLRNYAGDERIKQFIFDLISPPTEGEKPDYSNHEGLSAPVPRGRKGRKAKKDSLNNTQMVEDLAKLDIDPDSILRDEGYKKHLKRHANKVLLRVRLLYYLKQEVIGDQAPKVFMSLPAYEINIPTPYADGDPPAFWWDLEADRSMLIGVYKHGYEKYNLMRQDPCLIFLDRCGPPDSKALMAEQNDDDDVPRDDEEEEEAKPVKKRRKKKTDGDDEFEMDLDEDSSTPTTSQSATNMNQPTADGKLPFPSVSDLNTRLRRVVTGYQRSHKKEIMRQEQRAKRMEKREKFEAILKEREKMKRDSQQVRWSRREEADFYRVVSTFGVERDRRTGEFIWDTFRNLARLDKKYDETLTDYFRAFYFMCKRVCKRFQSEEEAIPPNSMYVEPITEERASRCLARVDLLNMIREQILWHPKLEERLKLCQSAPEMPDWWVCGEHDKDVLIGAAKHGLARTDYHILYDPKLAFREIVKEKTAAKEATDPNASEIASKDLEPGEICPSEKSPVKSELPSHPKLEESEETVLNLVKEEKQPDKVELEEIKSKEIKSEDKASDQEGDGSVQDKETEDNKMDTSPVKEEENMEKDSPSKPVEEMKEEPSPMEDEDNVKCKIESEEAETEPVKEEKCEMEATEEKESDHAIEEKKDICDDKLDSEAKLNLSIDQEASAEVKQEKDIEPVREESSVAKIENLIKTELGKHYSVAGNDSDNSVVCMDEHPLAPFRKYMTGSTSRLDTSVDGDERYGQLPYLDPATAEMMANSSIQWPKDRVIFYRLENICFCIEKGEWPSQRKYIPAVPSDSRSSTPVAGAPSAAPSGAPSGAPPGAPSGGTPKPGTPQGPDYTVSQNAEGLADGLKMTFQKKRKRRTKAEIEADRAARMREIMGLSVSGVSDVDSDSNISGTPISHHGVDFSPLRREEDSGLSGAERMMEMPMPKRRGRKRKIDKLMEEAQAAAAAAAAANASAAYMSLPPSAGHQMAWPLAAHHMSAPSASMTQATIPTVPPHDPNGRVPVLNLEDGSRLSGDEAPKQKHLDKWLDEHPGYMVDRPDPEDEVQAELQELGLKGGRRGRRKSRIDPHKLELDQVTGEENVSVINRETGKRITGAKAPPLKYLEEWLKRNPAFDVDPKWYHIVSAKIRLPDELQPRVLKPSGRGRRPNSMLSASTTSASSLLASDYYSSASMASLAGLSNAGLMASYSKMAYPYAGMAGMGMNPLYAAQLAQYGLLSGLRKPGEDPGQEAGEVRKEEDGNSKEEDSTSPSSKAGSTPAMHPSFPYMYNPLLFNQLYAQSLAAATGSFQLPASMSASFASLAAAQQSMMNGMGVRGESDEDTDLKAAAAEKEQDAAEDLSVRSHSSKSVSRSQDSVTDLSVKKRKREHRSSEYGTDYSMKASNSSSVSLDLSMKKAVADSSLSLDLSSKDKELPKTSLESTPEKSKHSTVSKHRSPKALMDVIKELKSNKQRASKSKIPLTPSKEETDLDKTSPIKDNKDSPQEQGHSESPVKESGDVV